MYLTTRCRGNQGNGFLIDSETKDEIFVHYSQLQIQGYKLLNTDDIVNYEIGIGNNGRKQAISVLPFLTRRMIVESLKEENLHIQTMKDAHGVTKYLVIDQNNVIQTDENGMAFLELAAFAGYDIDGLDA